MRSVLGRQPDQELPHDEVRGPIDGRPMAAAGIEQFLGHEECLIPAVSSHRTFAWTLHSASDEIGCLRDLSGLHVGQVGAHVDAAFPTDRVALVALIDGVGGKLRR